MVTRTVLMLVCLLVTPALAEQILRSTPVQATLLELYTSEGCSSCPPADRWFSGLVGHPELWKSLVPVAFHVDYWNDLGWEDRFASPAYSLRQRVYRQQGSTNGVYTPGVLAAGAEWQSWRQHPGQVPFSDAETGLLEFRDGGGKFTASYAPAQAGQVDPLQLHVALLGFGMSTPVRAGENRGRELRHDFVVLSHAVFGGARLNWSGPLPVPALAQQAQRLAVVAWVSPANRQAALQAVGGWR
jgi:hypothetical protein